MYTRIVARSLVLSVALALCSGPAYAQVGATTPKPATGQPPATPQKPYEPQVGQGGKDVVWVPTPQALVDKMLDMATVARSSPPPSAVRARRASNTTPTWSSFRSVMPQPQALPTRRRS